MRLRIHQREDASSMELLQNYRNQDAAQLADMQRVKRQTYVQYRLADLLKSGLVRGLVLSPDAYMDASLIEDRRLEALKDLENLCRKDGFVFRMESYDTDLTVFLEQEGRLIGLCRAEPRADGAIFIEKPYMWPKGHRETLYISMLSVVILQLSQYFRPETAVYLYVNGEAYLQKVFPLLGKNAGVTEEIFYEKIFS